MTMSSLQQHACSDPPTGTKECASKVSKSLHSEFALEYQGNIPCVNCKPQSHAHMVIACLTSLTEIDIVLHSAGHALTERNLMMIKRQFVALSQKVQSALEFRQVNVDDVCSFLVRYFSRDDWIQNQHPSSFTQLFDTLSVFKLWNYDHCGPLELVSSQFLSGDADMKALFSEYKGQLTGFYTATKLADYIKLSEFDDSEQDPHETLPVDTYKMADYRKLKLTLNLGNRKLSAIALSYVDDLWRSLAEEFDLPSLTAVIHSIIKGSLEVTWLILPHIAERIVARSSKAVKFFRDHGIIQVTIDDSIIYNEEQMVS